VAAFSDVLRPNRYRVEFHVPFANEELQTESFSYLCTEATFPFFTVNTIESWYNNRTQSFASKIDYDPVSFSFIVDKSQKILKFLDSWRMMMIDEKHRIAYKDEYAGMIDVYLMDNLMVDKASCRMVNAYPINTDSIPLSYESNDQAMKVTTSFKFDWVEYNISSGSLKEMIKRELTGLSDTIGKAKDSAGNMIEKAKGYFS
jgi:hypothetical protein